jgi:hemerythrin-like domain-containing protein
MHELIASLRRDHINCGRLIDLVRQHVERSDGAPPDWLLLGRIMRYMVEYGDVFHHRIEELLYAHLRDRAGGSRTHLDEIAEEHVQLERKAAYCSSLVAATPALRDEAAAVAAMRDYVDQLEAHMYREETQLFNLATLLFTPADWRAIEQEISVRSDPIFNAPVHEGYQVVVRYLSMSE